MEKITKEKTDYIDLLKKQNAKIIQTGETTKKHQHHPLQPKSHIYNIAYKPKKH